MKIETVVFIYMYVCICVVVYDFLFIYQTKFSEYKLPGRVLIIKDLLKKQYDLIKQEGKPDIKLQKKLIRYLKQLPYLTALSLILIEDKELVVFWAGHSTDVLHCLTRKYYHKSDEKKAFLAYLISKMELVVSTEANTSKISRTAMELVNYMKEQSVYVRENAFKAILSFGDYQSVLWAIKQMNENPSHQNERLLGDDLLEFKGDRDLLCKLLFHDFDELTPTIQVAFINYMRFVSNDFVNQEKYYEQFYILLVSNQTNKEVRLALIRYFRRNKYSPVYQLLLDFISEKNELMWEYAAVSASTIAVYLGEETIPALLKALKSRSWYIRFNAAESLLSLNIDCEQFFENEKDSFAEEMLQFRMQIQQQKVKSREIA